MPLPQRADSSVDGPAMPVLLVLFAGTGCAALIYEIVWLQMLELVVGSTAVSIAALLGTFMGGMCLGSLILPKLIPPRWHPLKVYAALELLAAFFGVAVLHGLPWIERGGALQRGLLCALCLLPPTIPMGATLPIMARIVKSSGIFYAVNIAGGVVGCLLAGFWLLRVFDMAVASYAAAGLNVLIAVAAFAMAAWIPYTPPAAPSLSGEKPRRAFGVYAAIALSGLTALGAEVLWTRLLALTFGATVYTFSIILAVFLIGLGIGSAAGSFAAKRSRDPRVLLAMSQALLVIAIAYAAWMIASRLPYQDRNLSASANPWAIFGSDFLRSCAAILPAAMLWGASFPLALESAKSERETVGEVYAANTLGAIAGALLIALAAAAALIFARRRVALLAVVPVAALLAWVVPPVPWQLVAFGRRMTWEITGPWKKLYAAEGVNSSIAYTEWVDKRRFFHVAGKIEASSTPADMRLQRILGHLPALLSARPRSVLIVGCGAGVTAGAFVVHPEVDRITL